MQSKKMAIKNAMIVVTHRDDSTKRFVATGPDHNACYDYLACAYRVYARADYNWMVEEGFETTTGEFVNRERAYMIANGNNQLSSTNSDGILQSWMIKNYIDKID